ncbi:MAG: SRPBCC family protein [Pseudohongiellaceae bacterium]|nr:SRPBCC family protein [Pseudohongiellaceae bacterium]
MILAEHTITIERTIDAVFDYISNHENYVNWFPGAISVVSKNELPHGTTGKIYTEQVKLLSGRLCEMEIPVVRCTRPSLFVTEGQFSPLHPRMEIRLERLGADLTKLQWVFSSRNQSTLGRFLVRILAKRNLLKRSTEAMANLKSILEQTEKHL